MINRFRTRLNPIGNHNILLSTNNLTKYINEVIFLNIITPSEYNLSLSLLVKMYQDLFKQEFDIMPAPHWRLLIQYGGNLTIDEFRDQFNKVEYKDIGERFTHIPEVQNSNKVYEQKIKF